MSSFQRHALDGREGIYTELGDGRLGVMYAVSALIV